MTKTQKKNNRVADEVTLAAAVVARLNRENIPAYQEVMCGGRRADIVADRKGLKGDGGLEVIEVKRQLNAVVLYQSLTWRDYASRVSVAVARGVHGRYWAIFEPFIERFGVGVYEVNDWGNGPLECRCVIAPERRAVRAESMLRGRLHELQKTYAPAGNGDGRYLSGWKVTTYKLVEFVFARHENGLTCTINEAIKGISHHYTTDKIARSCLVRQIKHGDIPELTIKHRLGETLVEPTVEINDELLDIFARLEVRSS